MKITFQRIKIGFSLLARHVINMAKAGIPSRLKRVASKYLYLSLVMIRRLNLVSVSFERLNIDPEKKTVAIIMPIYNQFSYTRKTLVSYYKSLDEAYNYILIIYDNHSTDRSRDYFYSDEVLFDNLCYIRYKRNMGVTWAWNDGIRFSLEKLKASYIFLSNNDLVFTKQSIGKMIDTLRQINGPAIVGPLSNCPGFDLKQNIRTFYPEYKSSDQVRDIESIAAIIANNRVIDANHVCGFCWGGNTQAFEENLFAYFIIPYYFDPRNEVYGNEDEFQKRFIEKGFKILLSTNIFIFHYGNISVSRYNSLGYHGHKMIMSQADEKRGN